MVQVFSQLEMAKHGLVQLWLGCLPLLFYTMT
jgi:hypothetical protein